jgi:adenylosuccinate synthase
MTENELSVFLSEQKRMASDINEIKITVKEAAQVVIYMQKTVDEVKERSEKEITEVKTRLTGLERAHNDCPARLRVQGWGMSAKDLAWLVAFVGGILALYAALK